MAWNRRGSLKPSSPPATTGLQKLVLPLLVKANQKSLAEISIHRIFPECFVSTHEMGNPQTATRDVRKRASGRTTPPFLSLSLLKSQVWSGMKRNITITIDQYLSRLSSEAFKPVTATMKFRYVRSAPM